MNAVKFREAESAVAKNGERDQNGLGVASLLEPETRLRFAIGIATRGRPSILAATLADLDTQIRRPDAILVSYADPADIGDAARRFPHVVFLRSAPGLTRQRNTLLRSLNGEEILTFLDDDFYLHPRYLQIMEQVFRTEPSVVVTTGRLLADGINSAGLTPAEALQLIAQAPPLPDQVELTPRFNGYGCNFSFRMAPIRAHQLRFDENLPLYGWQEDVDFCRQVAPYGRIVRVESALGVHLGTKGGRQSGYRLGYSQIANPWYLARKGTVSGRYALAYMVSQSAKNLVRSLNPEPYVDRRGRLRGNARGWLELVTGSLAPLRVEQFGGR